MPENEEGLEDMADMDLNQPIPNGWEPEQDELPFDAKDKDDDADA